MNDINYWDRFLMTGSVSDFLAYKNALEDAGESADQGFREEDKSGGQTHAGVYRDYGNGFKG